jgi:NADPH2:quinone reductase
MRAIIIQKLGGPEVLQCSEVAIPSPGPGQVLVQVAYAGVNPADWKNREGYLEQYRPYVFPYVIGFDAAGVVAELGDGVEGFAVGDRVFTPTNHGQGEQGSYAEFTLANADRVAVIPDSLGFREAAALPVAALTAWQGLFDRGGLQAGDLALIHGGSGGVGSFAVQFARRAGARVVATCSTANLAYVESLGAERVIDYTREDIPRSVTAWAPGGLDYLMDAVGVSTLPGAVALVREGGTFVSIPTLVDDGDMATAIREARSRGVNKVYAVMDDSNCADTLRRIADMLVAGEIQPPPIREFDLPQVAAAHDIIQRGHNRGKLVLKVAELN